MKRPRIFPTFLMFVCAVWILCPLAIGQSKDWDEMNSLEKRSTLIESLYRVGQPSFSRKMGFTPRRDCSGLIEAMFFQAGLDVHQFIAVNQIKGNGVKMIYEFVERIGKIFTQTPAAGDLIFFSNTYDRNHDGKFNDDLTHVGVVKSIDDLGTITFLDQRKGRIHQNQINLAMPSMHNYRGNIVNSYLRNQSRSGSAQLASTLFFGFGSVLPES
ncbi:MAG: NlpC/P60 family protein [Bdellovibrionota bacterium]